MIVRISAEDQYRLPDEDAVRLRELDDKLLTAIEANDEPLFHELFDKMVKMVRTDGHPIDELIQSDVIMPPADLTFEEAKHEFGVDGLIP